MDKNLEFKIPGTEITIPIVLLPQSKKDKKSGQWIQLPPAPYMKVPQRLVWFNIEKPDWIMETEVELEGDSYVRFKCTIKDPSGKIMRTARKSKTIQTDKDYESAETGAIGRCLALLGYGTQYAEQDMEEDDLADAPSEGIKKAPQQSEVAKAYFEAIQDEDLPNFDELPAEKPGGNPTKDRAFKVGKHKGKLFSEVADPNYIHWVKGEVEHNLNKCGADLKDFYGYLKDRGVIK